MLTSSPSMKPFAKSLSAHDHLQSDLAVRTCHTLEDAHKWAKHAVSKANAYAKINRAVSPISSLQGEFSMSTSCSGVDTPVFATVVFLHAVNEARSGQAPVVLRNVFAVEKSQQCREELLWSPHAPMHLFANQLDFLSDDTVRACCQSCSGVA